MNARRFLTSYVLLAVFWSGLSAAEITIGSFNLEWFGHGFKPRTDEDISRMANYIRSLEVDILACQEIRPQGDTSQNGTSDWQDLLQELGQGFQGWYGSTGNSQRLAFIWRTNRVEVTDCGELRGIQRETVPNTTARTFPRIPITAYVKSWDGEVDFRIITMHLYWTSDAARYAEASRLNTWCQAYLQGQDDQDVVLIGDCNTKPMGAGETGNSTTINNLEAGMICISDDHTEYTTPDSEERYDHAFLSPDLMNEYIEGSWDVRREVVEAYPNEYMRDISNHVPVTLRITDEDNDNTPAGDWGV
jgi:endonuclease/exonuclease/phosphatase family metal-dependent hydrolase